jgi:hypothetical protein
MSYDVGNRRNRVVEMPRSIESRISTASPELKVPGTATEYLAALRENWRLAEAQLRRSYLLWLLAAALYALIRDHSITEFALGPVKVKSFGAVGKTLPIVMSTLSYSIIVLVTHNAIYERVHDTMMQKFSPLVYQADLEQPLHPPGSVVSGETSTWPFFGRPLRRIFSRIIDVKNLLIVFAPLVGTLLAIASLVIDFSGGIAIAAGVIAGLFSLYSIVLGAGLVHFYFSEP